MNTRTLLFCTFFIGINFICSSQNDWGQLDLKVTTFRNGDKLFRVYDENSWQKAKDESLPAYFVIGEGENVHYLYNWDAVHDKRGLAPIGYSIPSEKDFNRLDNSKYLQDSSWQKTSDNYFNAIPNGYIEYTSFDLLSQGMASYFWTVTKGKSLYSISYIVIADEKGIVTNEMRRENFCSVRCTMNEKEKESFIENENKITAEKLRRLEEIQRKKREELAEKQRIEEEKERKRLEQLAEEQRKIEEKRLAEQRKKELEALQQRQAEERARIQQEQKRREALRLEKRSKAADVNSSYPYLSINILRPSSAQFKSLPSIDAIINSDAFNDAFYENGQMEGSGGVGIELGGLIQLNSLKHLVPHYMEVGIPIDINTGFLSNNMSNAGNVYAFDESYSSYLRGMDNDYFSFSSVRIGASATFHLLPFNEKYPVTLDTYLKTGFGWSGNRGASGTYYGSFSDGSGQYDYTDDVVISRERSTFIPFQIGAQLRFYRLVSVGLNYNFGMSMSAPVNETHTISGSYYEYSSGLTYGLNDQISSVYNANLNLNHYSVNIGVNLLVLLAILGM